MIALTCIYMCFNIDRNIMKKINMVVPILGSKGKSLCVCFVFLTIVYFLCFKNSFTDNLCTRLKCTT